MRNALRSVLAAGALVVGCTIIAGLCLFDYLTDPRPYQKEPPC